MTARRIPQWSELKPLLQTKKFEWNATKRRLATAHTIADLRRIAKRRTPTAPFDYTDGAAEAETSLWRARRAFARLQFNPSILRDVSKIDTSTTIQGRPSAYPIIFAPTGFTRMMHTEGERAVVRVAQKWGIPYALSTMGTTSIEDVAAAGPEANKWFQLYIWSDHERGKDLLERSHRAGFTTLILTVDVPVAGARMRDVRNGLTIPPALTLKTFLDGAMHPNWWFDFLTTEPLQFASLSAWKGTAADLINHMFDPTVTLKDLDWIRESWPGKLVIKGIQTLDDAQRVVDAGADGIVLSNHGGRQLDKAPVPLELLPSVAAAVGDRTEVYLDTGVTSGSDVAAAVALGAKAVMVGRAYLYGLMAGGELGVDRAAEILTTELRRTMALLGVNSVDELNPGHVTLR
jgi:L-lactate dehydrogenase (cytochrome)